MSEVEILTLAIAKTDAGVILSRSTDWIEPRKFDCENCGEILTDGVRQAVRDEGCLYACRECDAIANERLPFEQARSRSLGQGNLLSRSGGFAYSYDAVLLTTDCTTIFGLLCAPYG